MLMPRGLGDCVTVSQKIGSSFRSDAYHQEPLAMSPSVSEDVPESRFPTVLAEECISQSKEVQSWFLVLEEKRALRIRILNMQRTCSQP